PRNRHLLGGDRRRPGPRTARPARRPGRRAAREGRPVGQGRAAHRGRRRRDAGSADPGRAAGSLAGGGAGQLRGRRLRGAGREPRVPHRAGGPRRGRRGGMTGGPVGVAIVGAGVISGEYLKNLTSFPDVRVLAIGDLDVERAAAVAAQYGVPASGDLDAVLAIPEVELVVNLTTPAAHLPVARAALRAGKHVYGEKPLTLDPASGEKLLAEA